MNDDIFAKNAAEIQLIHPRCHHHDNQLLRSPRAGDVEGVRAPSSITVSVVEVKVSLVHSEHNHPRSLEAFGLMIRASPAYPPMHSVSID